VTEAGLSNYQPAGDAEIHPTFRPLMSIRAIIDLICETDDLPTGFVEDWSPIQPLLDVLGRKLPPDLAEYIEKCIPTASYGRMVEFHSLDRLIEENRDYVPGADTIHQGFLCFAKEGDGSQFAYCCDDRWVYHISEEAGEDTQATRTAAYESWNSLADFLSDYLVVLRELNEKQG
jgi:hypothetical protein